jgi:hypothetical protein
MITEKENTSAQMCDKRKKNRGRLTKPRVGGRKILLQLNMYVNIFFIQMSIIPSRKLFHSKPQIIATSLNILSCVI